MKKFLILFLFLPLLLVAQQHISGVLVDANTNETLPFANITTNNNQGTITNVDGKFYLESDKKITTLNISYIGYKTKKVALTNSTTFIKIKLIPTIESIEEVVITNAENPALSIIRNVIKNKNKNNIEKALNTFKFKAYNKLVVTANPDSIKGTIDTIYKIKKGVKKFIAIDSTNYEFKKTINRSHLYLTEKISDFTFEKGKKKKETILASRMAGFKQPIYEILALKIQDFSVYNETYVIAGTKYINPIADKALKHYEYQILDTVKNAVGNSFMIHFKPKKEEKTVGLEGVLYIDTNSYAITSSISELRGVIDVKATQNFNYFKSEATWFPIETEITIKKGKNDEQLSLFGGLVDFTSAKKDSTTVYSQKTSPEKNIYFSSKTKHFDIKMNVPVKVKNSANTLKIVDEAYDRTEKYWNTFRTDSITKRGKETYVVLDSIIKKEGVEDKIAVARGLFKGQFATKYINLNLGKIISLNNYEGLRIGFGGVTNTNFSKKYRIESYIAYGTKDKDFKYHFGGAFRLNRDTNTWFGASYTNDIKEAASLDFIAENNSFIALNPRNLNISNFYNYKIASILLEHDLQPNLEAKLQFSSGKYTPKFNYQYISNNNLLTNYNLTTAVLGLQYNPKSEYMNSPIGKTRIKNAYPQYTLQVTKSFANILKSDFDFTQVNFKIDHQIKRLNAATTSFLLQGGIVFGDAPISHLYNATPNYTFKNPWTRRVTFAGKNSFETMGYNEFISDKYAMLQVKHKIYKHLKITKRFKPQITLITRAAIGTINNPINHAGISFKNMEKGYFESGLEMNEIYKGFGLSGFYRYGAYQNTEWSDNLAVKLTYNLSLGF